MTDQSAGRKTMDQLKNERTTAKRSFTRLVNNVTRSYNSMTEEQLRDSFNKLHIGAERVMEANDEVKAGLIAEEEAELEGDELVSLTEQQEAELTKTANECDLKLKELGELLQGAIWQGYGEAELYTAVEMAEAECDRVAAVEPDGNHEAYKFMTTHLMSLVEGAKKAHSKWQQWVPLQKQKDFRSRLRGLELHTTRLISRTASFIKARREEDQRSGVTNILTNHAPTIKLKPTTLPKFSGSRRDFHRWKKDWESLQKQGEPTGSKEVKKFQLLDSLEEKIMKESRLSTYNTAEDILRVLENRYGNRTAIAIEIVEDLQRMLPIRSSQPRKIVELIQAVEKALWDLSDLGDTGAIKKPL